ncbi:chloride channel protein CLC-e isoform X1 [Syzygium oleosum]|uniref:chloride channel protein CLC-e isoform X1 n=1 Tax=Syzygium oleosum TaxID=219896 RepID=UPI0024B9E878|nr:chloride channel protein CLC-e isoform X1 [Syzygium oleosum]
MKQRLKQKMKAAMASFHHSLLISSSHQPPLPLFSETSIPKSSLPLSPPPSFLLLKRSSSSSPSPAANSVIRIRCSRYGEDDSSLLQDDDVDDALAPREQTRQRGGGGVVGSVIQEALSRESGNWVIVSSCLVGLLTGISVVIFNSGVDEIRDLFWDGIPSRGASWLREEPIEAIWTRVILVPACGGLIVGVLNAVRSGLEEVGEGGDIVKVGLRPFLKAVAACVTLGTGNSLGPEGPSVEIGVSVAKGVGKLFDNSSQRRLSLVAAGSAAGISSGFNAAVAGCFFAVESVLWPSPADLSMSLTNNTSMVILSAVIASIVSEVGLGSQPAFKVPLYDFRSPGELPLYLLLGALCGLVSLALSRCTSYMLVIVDNIHEATGMPRAAFPVMGGLTVGIIALAYPEILYWGFENVDILLESGPFVKGLSADLLLQLVAVKILATSLCRASGLVGGFYAPSLFIGAATGTAYGKLISSALSQLNPIFHLSILEVASPQAYGLVGMAATLAGVCQVPLTSVLLLFELTQDYRIVLPLLGAVGLSSWITSGQSKRRDSKDSRKLDDKGATKTYKGNTPVTSKFETSGNRSEVPSSYTLVETTANAYNLCDVESSLCLEEPTTGSEELEGKVLVAQAMRTRYVSVQGRTLLSEAVSLMLAEKQSCAVIVDDDRILVGLLTLEDIQGFIRSSTTRRKEPKILQYVDFSSQELLVSELCSLEDGKCQVPWTAVPSMNLLYARTCMNRHGLSHVPVVSEQIKDHRGHPVGLLDTECISLTCRVLAMKELFK